MSDTPLTTDRRELIEQRERQRRQLHHVPTRLLQEARWYKPPDPPTGSPADEVERYVRDAADRALTPDARDLLERSSRAEASRWARSALNCFDRGAIVQNAVGPAIELVTDDPPREEDLAIAPNSVSSDLLTFAALALVADRAADDGYADERIGSAR